MITNERIGRRTLLLTAVVACLLPSRLVRAAGLPTVTVHRDPTCGCCGAWVDHLRAAGYPATVIEAPEIKTLKARLGLPQSLWSCHTAEVDGYLLEGHVPAAALARLLAERPAAKGLAVPGMPVGSPGMEVAGVDPATYDVLLFGDGEPQRFMRFRGNEAV
jgi:hypothetical protein